MTLLMWSMVAMNLITILLFATGYIRWMHPDPRPKCSECKLIAPPPPCQDHRSPLPMWQEPILPIH